MFICRVLGRCHVASPTDLNLIVAKSSRIEVQLITTGDLQPVFEAPIYGRVTVLELFRPEVRTYCCVQSAPCARPCTAPPVMFFLYGEMVPPCGGGAIGRAFPNRRWRGRVLVAYAETRAFVPPPPLSPSMSPVATPTVLADGCYDCCNDICT